MLRNHRRSRVVPTATPGMVGALCCQALARAAQLHPADLPPARLLDTEVLPLSLDKPVVSQFGLSSPAHGA